MPHIHNQPGEHDLTVSALIVRTDTDHPQLLLHMHKNLGMLLQPGGHVELDESPWQAICREVAEETGYGPEQLMVLQPPVRITKLSGATLHPQPVVINTHEIPSAGGHRHSDISFAFVANGEPAMQLGSSESDTIRWVNELDLASLDEAELPLNLCEIGKFVLGPVLESWEPVALDTFER